MYTIYSLQLHELHEYNFSNHPWNLFAQLNNDPRFFFTVEGPNYAIKWPPTSISGVWRGNEKSRRVIANGYNGGPARPRERRTVSPRGGLTSCGLITSFLGRKVGGPWLNTGRERKLVVKHWRGGRGPSIHPPPSSKRETYFRSARAQNLRRWCLPQTSQTKTILRIFNGNIKEIIFVRRRWAGMIEIIY